MVSGENDAEVLEQKAGLTGGRMAMKEGEVLYIIEEDKGDGWTRARRQNGEEGYVPTSYIDVTPSNTEPGQ